MGKIIYTTKDEAIVIKAGKKSKQYKLLLSYQHGLSTVVSMRFQQYW